MVCEYLQGTTFSVAGRCCIERLRDTRQSSGGVDGYECAHIGL